MATLQELKSVLKETLENRGVLDQVKARIRAEVFNALDDPSEPRPVLSNENMIINELIREYLEFNQYKYTASVLQSESGQSIVPLDRSFLATELNVVEDRGSSSVPLLYGLIAHFRNKEPERRPRATSPRRTHIRSPRSTSPQRRNPFLTKFEVKTCKIILEGILQTQPPPQMTLSETMPLPPPADTGDHSQSRR